MELKFEIDEKVRVKSTGKVGTVQGFRVIGSRILGQFKVVNTYEIKYEDYKYTDWFREEQLETVRVYEFDKKFEAGLADLMIDINLGKENLNLQMVKNFYDIKQSLSE